MAMPYLLLRLVDDFTDVRRWVMRASEVGLFVAAVGLLFVAPSPLPGVSDPAVYVAYFFTIEIYCGVALFAREALRSSGVTRRRMQAVAVGSIPARRADPCSRRAAGPPPRRTRRESGPHSQGLGLSLLSGLCYIVGFAPPALLRRAWQEPELRAFLGRAARPAAAHHHRSDCRRVERGPAATSLLRTQRRHRASVDDVTPVAALPLQWQGSR